MAETNTSTQTDISTPTIVYGNHSEGKVALDPLDAASAMHELNISEQTIGNSAVFVDPKNRLLNYGTHYPGRLGRLRFHSIPELKDVEGDIIRISTRVRGKDRTAEEMNRTFTHELEHLAQHDRHDKKVTAGHIAVWGLAALGAVVGSHTGKNKLAKTAGMTLGAIAGYEAGYMIAPHERQARNRAREVTSSALRRIK